MNDVVFHVQDAASLEKAISQKISSIEVVGRIADLSSLKLPAGTNLRGAGPGAELHFKSGQPGLMLSSNHHISSLRLITDETQIAIGLSDDTDDLGMVLDN